MNALPSRPAPSAAGASVTAVTNTSALACALCPAEHAASRCKVTLPPGATLCGDTSMAPEDGSTDGRVVVAGAEPRPVSVPVPSAASAVGSVMAAPSPSPPSSPDTAVVATGSPSSATACCGRADIPPTASTATAPAAARAARSFGPDMGTSARPGEDSHPVLTKIPGPGPARIRGYPSGVTSPRAARPRRDRATGTGLRPGADAGPH
jgi:hypothetical protein